MNPLNYGIIPSLGNSNRKSWLGHLNYNQNANIKILNDGVIFNTNNKLLDKSSQVVITMIGETTKGRLECKIYLKKEDIILWKVLKKFKLITYLLVREFYYHYWQSIMV